MNANWIEKKILILLSGWPYHLSESVSRRSIVSTASALDCLNESPERSCHSMWESSEKFRAPLLDLSGKAILTEAQACQSWAEQRP